MSAIYKNGRYYGVGGGGGGADTEIIAKDFDPTESYDIGKYVMQEGDLYKCTTAHTGEWDESDFDSTQVMEEIPIPMPAADMSDIVTPLPSVMSRRFKYSTEEQVVGEWIDGKPVYQKVISQSNTSKSLVNIDLSSLNIENVINLHGVYTRVVNSSRTLFIPFYNYDDGNTKSILRYDTSNSCIQYQIVVPESTNLQIITVRYTKTTD